MCEIHSDTTAKPHTNQPLPPKMGLCDLLVTLHGVLQIRASSGTGRDPTTPYQRPVYTRDCSFRTLDICWTKQQTYKQARN